MEMLEDLDQVMEIVARALPPCVPGVSQQDFDILYGTRFHEIQVPNDDFRSVRLDWTEYMAMTPSSPAGSTTSNQTTSLYRSGPSSLSDSVPNSPASLSDWIPSPQPYGGIGNPYLNSAMISSPPSMNSSPSPGSVETRLNQMSLAVSCGSPNPTQNHQRPLPPGPPPLIPVNQTVEKPLVKNPIITSPPQVAALVPAPLQTAGTVTAAAAAAAASAVVLPKVPTVSQRPAPAPVVVVAQPRTTSSFTTSRDEIMATMNQNMKEQSMRQVAKSPMETLIAADQDGDTYDINTFYFLLMSDKKKNIIYV